MMICICYGVLGAAVITAVFFLCEKFQGPHSMVGPIGFETRTQAVLSYLLIFVIFACSFSWGNYRVAALERQEHECLSTGKGATPYYGEGVGFCCGNICSVSKTAHI